jgi:hypothetical protein
MFKPKAKENFPLGCHIVSSQNVTLKKAACLLGSITTYHFRTLHLVSMSLQRFMSLHIVLMIAGNYKV